jgi:furin
MNCHLRSVLFLVHCSLLDDGIEKDHPDLIRNYDPLSSTDINDGDSDPNPRQLYI